MYYAIRKNGELYHYGITGQKWGYRRYQNEDGTLTAEGKIRYGKTNPGDPAIQSTSMRIRNKGLKKYQNDDGTLTPKGKKKFSKLIDAYDKLNVQGEKLDKHQQELHKYMKKNNIQSREDIQDKYSNDTTFKKYVDLEKEIHANYKNELNNYLNEYLYVSISNFDAISTFGNPTVNVILNEYYKNKIKNL